MDTKKIDEFQSLGLKLDDGATVISKYDGKKVPNILVIKLKYPVPYSEGQKVNAASKGRFTSDAKTFFASREISDILLIDE
ncbi:hypothetical protein [Pedobacter xixiisoli]|uniref:hypothetical protein n=1 Tax=Pedobacter xixiisoli TaxID=1476464 RepID=UPI00110C9F5C|nr:hypothetical protein [Pedobacter xixiisoli]